MKKVLFTHSYFLSFDAKQKKVGQPYPPLATIIAASFLRENGYEVRLFDTMFSNAPSEIIPLLKLYKPDYLVIYDDGFNYLTKMCLTNMREAAFQMAKLGKKSGARTIISSSDSSDHYEKYLNNSCDYVIIGEAEQTLLELMDKLDANEPIANVKGISYKNENKTFVTEKRIVLNDLDTLPLAAWDLINIKKYKKTWIKKNGFFSINMATTRGCPYKCNWCAKPIYGNRYNLRSPKSIVKELKYLKDNFQFDHVWFCDDIFGIKPGWVKEFAELVKKEKLLFKYKIQSRADLLLDENYVKYLSDSGCRSVWLGAESGSQKILDAMDKGIQVEEIHLACFLLRKYGIEPSLFIQFGYLGEKYEDIELTINMVNEILPEDIGVSISYPLPGTKFYEKVKEDLKGKKANWTDSDDLSMMFKNTFSPQFYKQLHRYVHKNYRKNQAFHSLRLISKSLSKLSFKRIITAASLIYYIPTAMIEKEKLNLLKK